MASKKEKSKLELNIEPQYAFGSEKEQTWYFLGYNKENLNLRYRWVILRKYRADGVVWWGIRPQCETHENGFENIQQELEIAKKAIKYLKKNWKKHLSY